MNYYQELTILPCSEIDPFFIWGKLFNQVHLGLVECAKAKYGDDATHGDIGVNFPEYKCFEKNGKTITYLGDKLRVFAATEDELHHLNLNKWCDRLLDYVHIKNIKDVDAQAASHVIVRRFRQVKNNDRTTRSLAKKHGSTFAEAKAFRIKHFAEKHGISIQESEKHYDNPRLEKRPYIIMKSLGNKHSFSLEVDQQPSESAVSGRFSTYGLSSTTTVPHW